MHHEIERKFLVTTMPSLSGIQKIPQERYFIQRGDLLEEGLRRKGDFFEYEIKRTLSKKEKTRERTFISKAEFEASKAKGTRVIERDSYVLSKKSPLVSIKKYRGIYRGLVLAEVEFDSVTECEKFIPFDWMGTEVTETALGKDAKLVDLDRDHFEKVLAEMEQNFNTMGMEGSYL